MRTSIALAAAAIGAGLLACGPVPPMTVSLRRRVANEYACPHDKIVVTSLGAGAYRVQACGHVATYSCVRHMGNPDVLGERDQCIREPNQ